MAEEYKKISDLTEMLASDINSSTKMVVTTGELKGSKNLNVSDLVVGNLSTDSNYRALSSGMGKKLNDEKAPILNPVFSGTVSGVTKAMVGLSDADNTSDASKPISAATQIALNSKAATNSPTFTGVPLFSGDGAQFNCPVVLDNNVSVMGVLFGENEIGANKLVASETMQFNLDSTIKIQTGFSGSLPIYREFPATELNSSDLNGTNYVMVYGTGTPSENAAELQAAYDAAKTMPRYFGTITDVSEQTVYAGQTLHAVHLSKYYKIITTKTGIYTQILGSGNSVEITELQAKSTRTSVVVAPSEYNFGEFVAFNVNTSGIDIKSLTGKKDVLINSIDISSDYVYINGINCGIGRFTVGSQLPNVILENCEGGEASFGGTQSDGILFTSTCIDCKGGDYSFGAAGTALCACIRCTGGHHSFGGANGIASGYFEDCTGGDHSFGESTASGKFVRCNGGHYSFGSAEGTASGQFYYCTGKDYSFGKFASGEFNDCIANDYSFGWGTIGEGYFSGTARRCVGREGCFKSGGSGSANAKVYYCEAVVSEIVSMPHLYCISAGVVVP